MFAGATSINFCGGGIYGHKAIQVYFLLVYPSKLLSKFKAYVEDEQYPLTLLLMGAWWE